MPIPLPQALQKSHPPSVIPSESYCQTRTSFVRLEELLLLLLLLAVLKELQRGQGQEL